MFNKTLILPTHHVTERVTENVHVHRAPTDASVKLLREMEAAAQEEVKKAIHVGDTTFECVVHALRTPMDEEIALKAIFSLNGKKLEAEVRDYAWRTKPVDLVKKLHKEMAESIAAEVLRPALLRLDSWVFR